VLFAEELAARARPVLDGCVPSPAPSTTVVVKPAAAAVVTPVSTRSDALTVLAVLQREARLVDFLKEDISAYQDAQVGAAVRDVHRDAGAALERMFALRPVSADAEGAEVALPANVDAAKWRLVGNLGGQAPARGRLQHAGWQATKVEVPQFTGAADSIKVVAPAEVEV
jgi:hypothetical protein